MLNIFFRCFLAIWYSSGENSLFSFEPHFLMGLFDILESIFLTFFYIYWILVPYLIYDWKRSFPNLLVAFCLIDIVFCFAEALKFYEVTFIDSRSYSTSHCSSIQEFFPCANIFEAFPHFLLCKFQCLWFMRIIELCTRR